MNERRWEFEKQHMAIFPQFRAYYKENGHFGFFGYLQGQRSGTQYQVVMEACMNTYPAYEPRIYIDPRVGINVYASGALCVVKPWYANSSFAERLTAAAKYLEDK